MTDDQQPRTLDQIVRSATEWVYSKGRAGRPATAREMNDAAWRELVAKEPDLDSECPAG